MIEQMGVYRIDPGPLESQHSSQTGYLPCLPHIGIRPNQR